MRDLFITMLVFGSVPVALMRPFVGLIMWVWLSLMSPYRLTWGFAYDYPFVQLIALVTMAAWVLYREKQPLPMSAPTILLITFTIWVAVTTPFAVDVGAAFDRLIFVLKIFLLAYFIMLIVRSREQIHVLVWIVVISIGFFSTKGGIFTIMTGGQHSVLGPAGSFIADRNQLALAVVLTIPLMRYLQLNSAERFIRIGMGFAFALSVVAVFGSQSRGAFLAVTAMLLFLILKSRRRVLLGGLMIVLVPAVFAFMPAEWHERMSSIQDYEEDASAQGRLRAWGFAIDVALDRPITGGGFTIFENRAAYEQYTGSSQAKAAHSIIFQVLGEHGFVGLFLFFIMGIATWTTGSWVERQARDRPELYWARDLAAMIKVGLVGYVSAGLFANLAFFDLIYVVMAIMIVTAARVAEQVAPKAAETMPSGRLRLRRA